MNAGSRQGRIATHDNMDLPTVTIRESDVTDGPRYAQKGNEYNTRSKETNNMMETDEQ
jgi:hypothetical protein